MPNPTWLVLAVTAAATLGIGQDTRATTQSKPTSAPVIKDLFRPNPADKESKALLDLAKGKLAIDWMTREKAKPAPKAAAADVSEHLSVTARQRVAAVSFETDEPVVRAQVMKAGLLEKSGAYVLPLGRFEWEKAPLFVKPTETGRTAVICVVVASPSIPLGDVKGFRVKGEFQDRNGKRLAEFNQKSPPGSPNNGVFLLSMPAGDAMKQTGEYDGFQFKLLEVQSFK